MMRRLMRVMAVLSIVAAVTVKGADVTVTLVSGPRENAVSIEEKQALWKSPFGGWDITTWPFTLRVDDGYVFQYASVQQKLLKQAGEGNPDSALSAAILNEVFGLPDDSVDAEAMLNFRLDRRAAETIRLAAGKHVLHPFGMEFTVADDGTLTTDDPRLRIAPKASHIEMICYPVTVKLLERKRSVSGPIQLSLGATALLGGLDSLFSEYDKQNMLAPGTAMGSGFRRVTVYLPASSEGGAYNVNGVTFEVSGEGKVKLAPDAKARCDDDRTVFVDMPVGKPVVAAVMNPLGVSWFGSAGEVKIVCGSESVIVNEGLRIPGGGAKSETGKGSTAARDAGSGSGMVMVPATGNPVVQIGGLTARLPASDTRWPHRHLVCNVADGTCWAVETVPLEATPGAEWSCRITSAAGKAAIPEALKIDVVAVADGVTGGKMELTSAAGVFTGTLPAKPGLWRLRVAATDGSPLQGQTLGVALIGDTPVAAVSLFTVNNRALLRRGDRLDLLWVARRKAGSTAAEWPVRLRGVGLDATVARIAVSVGGDGSTDISGRLAVDTAALAAGEYTASVEADGVAGYPFRFRICQRERLSDFDIYSFGIHTIAAKPFPGSPINSYVEVPPGGPGMGPFLADGDGALDGVFGAYAHAPFGPVREMFARPGMNERHGMSAVAMGAHNAPTWPEAHSYEACNPKHTLPENLAWVRRRMALYAQTHADYPGVDGFDYGWNWQTSGNGWWSDSGPRLDAWQPEAAAQSEAAAWKLTQEMWPNVVAKYAHLKPIGKKLSDKWPKELADIPGLTEDQMRYVNGVQPNGWSMLLPNTFAEWYADLNEIMPGLTHHAHVSSPSLAGGIKYWEWYEKSHRSAVDFSERFMSPFDCFRAPAIMAMDNQEKQKIQLAIQTHNSRAQMVPAAFGAAGRGVDGFAFTGFCDTTDPDIIGLARVFERFGSWFTTFDPLPDVAIYYSKSRNGVFTALHDLARIRRPAMMVGPRDVEAGELAKYKVLLLVSIGTDLPPEIMEAFRAFEAGGGVILKDDSCSKELPGRSLGLAYDGQNLSSSWGGAQAGGEYEFVYVWDIFLKKEKALTAAFARTPQPPVTTPDTDVLISPLAGKDTIICFVTDQTEVPLAVTFPDEKSSRFRQQNVLPKIGELQVEKGWYVHNLLTGKPAPVESTAKGQRVPLELTRAEGKIYLLTRREPKSMTIRVDRTSPINARLTGGLADAEGKLLADPMPFEVTLKGPDGATLLHQFASIGPDHPFDVPVPAMSAGARPELILRDLVLGTTASQPLDPAAPAAVAVRQAPDLIGGEEKILTFFSNRKGRGPVTILLDEGQDAFRPAAEKVASMLKQAGREARVTTWDTADIRPLPLRWYLQKEDLEVLNSVTNESAWAWRINMSVWAPFEKDKFGNITKTDYGNPGAGYSEAGPRLRHDADVVLFGTPANHRAVADLAPYLRRVPTDNYPAPGGFFVHYVWSPFRAGYDALYVGCHDTAGAEAAVTCLAGLKLPEAAPVPEPTPEQKPVVVRGGAPTPLENMADVLGGTPIVSLDFAPGGNRLFAATLSYGEWVFVMDSDGTILDKRMPPETQVFPNWYRWGRYLTPLSDTLLRIWLWDSVYQYDLTRGWISRASKASLVEDPKAGRAFQGGSDRLLALDPQGRILWRYEDGTRSPDLSAVRDVSPRAISGDRRVLLVSAFAKGARNAIIAPSVLGLDCATGKVLWQRAGIPLNAGKVIALDDRFIVMADDNSAHELIAADGREGTAMASLSGSPDWVLQVPGRKALLIAENDHFDRNGPASRMYFLPLDGGAGQDLKVPGRVVAITPAPDNKSFAVATSVNRSLLFASDGTLLWETETPSASILRFSPDGKTIATAGRDGVVRLFNAADGKLRRETDLNIGNSITAEKYVKQERMGDVPTEAGRTPQPLPPEPSYLKSLPAKCVSFGPNLAPPERMRELLKPADPVTGNGDKPGYLGTLSGIVTLPPIKVAAGTTYLVELLNGVGIPTNTASLLRLEISVVGKQKSRNLPCTVRLPVDSTLERRRFAFRADVGDDVTLTMRAILPSVVTVRNTTQRSFDKVETSSIPVVIGDVVVSAIRFPGRNMLFDGGPGSGSKPSGAFTCMLYALNDGVTATQEIDVKSPTVPLLLVNGAIANNKTVWDKISGRPEGVLAYADAVVRFDRPSALSTIAVYEDTTGPVITEGESVRERTAFRYAVEVRSTAGQWARIGVVSENRQLVNIFPCPEYEIDSMRYVWAGRHDDMDLGRTDGFVRTAQIEAYVSGDALDLEYLMEMNEEGDVPQFD